ncbi:hypothetical protein HDU97_007590 [Phlyctochytrium planicorne]|nr:hypothetical protein HDU97_007590 [Phlyctochytrium planicorne]
MLLYRDVISGDELLSDAYKIKEIDDIALEVDCQMIVVKEGDVDIGGNPSAEGGEDEPLEDGAITVNNVVHSFRLSSTGFDKKGYMTYIKGYMKAVKAYLTEHNPDRVATFEKNATPFIKKILENFKDYEFYVGEGMNPEGMVMLLNYREDGTTPYFTLFKDGLKIEKLLHFFCISMTAMHRDEPCCESMDAEPGKLDSISDAVSSFSEDATSKADALKGSSASVEWSQMSGNAVSGFDSSATTHGSARTIVSTLSVHSKVFTPASAFTQQQHPSPEHLQNMSPMLSSLPVTISSLSNPINYLDSATSESPQPSASTADSRRRRTLSSPMKVSGGDSGIWGPGPAKVGDNLEGLPSSFFPAFDHQHTPSAKASYLSPQPSLSSPLASGSLRESPTSASAPLTSAPNPSASKTNADLGILSSAVPSASSTTPVALKTLNSTAFGTFGEAMAAAAATPENGEISPIFQFEDEKSNAIKKSEYGMQNQRQSRSSDSDGSMHYRYGRASPVSPPLKQSHPHSSASPTHSISSNAWGGKSVSPQFNGGAASFDTPSTAFTSGYSSGGLATASKHDLNTVSPLSFASSASTFHLPEGDHSEPQGVIEMEITRLLSSPHQLPRSTHRSHLLGSTGAVQDFDPSFANIGMETSSGFDYGQGLRKFSKPGEVLSSAAARSGASDAFHFATSSEHLPPPVPTKPATRSSSGSSYHPNGHSEFETEPQIKRHSSYQHIQQATNASPRAAPLTRSGSEAPTLANGSMAPSPHMHGVFSSSSSLGSLDQNATFHQQPQKQSPHVMFRPKSTAGFESLSPLTIPATDSLRNIWGAPDLTLAPSAFPATSGAGSVAASSVNGGFGGNVASANGYRFARPSSYQQLSHHLQTALPHDQAAADSIEATFPSKLLFGGLDAEKAGPLRDLSESLSSMSLSDSVSNAHTSATSGSSQRAHRQLSGDSIYFQTRASSMLPLPSQGAVQQQQQQRYAGIYDEVEYAQQQQQQQIGSVVDNTLLYRNQSGSDLASAFSNHLSNSMTTSSSSSTAIGRNSFSGGSVHSSPLAFSAGAALYSAGYSPQHHPSLGLGTVGWNGSSMLPPSAMSLGGSGITSPTSVFGHHGMSSTSGRMLLLPPYSSPNAGGAINSGPDQNLPIVREIQTSKLRVDESKLTRDYFDSLTREAREIIAEITPGLEELKMQEGVFEVVQEITRRVFADATLHHFGSTANGFSLTNSDMDLCICLRSADSLKISPAQCVEKIGHALKQAGMKDVKMLTRARVPIVKMRDPVTGIRCDVGFQNNLAIFNTRLLKTYSQIDPRFRELVFIVKYWSKRRNINEPYFGTLSSYCYVLMIIHLLQIRGVLPCLQRICPDGSTAVPAPVHPVLYGQQPGPGVPPVVEVDGYDVYFYDNLAELPNHWQSKNTESLGELIVAFFKYYSAEFPYVHGVASVRAGRVLSKEEKGWTKERQQELNRNGGIKDRFWLFEDPFEVSHNIGRPVDKETLYEVRGEFIRSSKFLCAGSCGENVLGKICEKQTAPLKKPGSGGAGGGNNNNNNSNSTNNGNNMMMGRKF